MIADEINPHRSEMSYVTREKLQGAKKAWIGGAQEMRGEVEIGRARDSG